MVLVRITSFVIECNLYLLSAILDHLSHSHIARHCLDSLVDAASHTLARLLSHTDVQTAVAQTIAQGMNAFLEQPNLDTHIRAMADTMSKTQPELARRQGEDFPVLVGNFLQGMLRVNKNNSTSPKPVDTAQPPLVAVEGGLLPAVEKEKRRNHLKLPSLLLGSNNSTHSSSHCGDGVSSDYDITPDVALSESMSVGQETASLESALDDKKYL